jgi:hypothetical protein
VPRKPSAFLGHSIDFGRFDFLRAAATDVGITQVVSQNHDEKWTVGGADRSDDYALNPANEQ